MSVEIRLVPRFQLRAIDENYTLELPVIEMAPANDDNIPHISRINCVVTGTPQDIIQKIASVYPQFNAEIPILLSSPQRLKQSPCRLQQPLPENVNCSLQVSVEYYDSDSLGNPALSAGTKTVTASSLMFTPVTTPVPQTPPEPQATPEPQVTPEPQATPEPQTPQTINTTQKTPDKFYPGWFAIDFGTSNSTVTLFDPRTTPQQDVLPQEQELQLRTKLKTWLNSSSTEVLPDVDVKEWETFLSDLRNNLSIPQSSSVGDLFLAEKSDRLLEGIKQIELCLAKRQPLFRKTATNHLNQIYHEAFRIPPLRSQSLYPVELDEVRREQEITSELEITNLEPLQILMGERAKQDRLQAIAQETNNNHELGTKFFHSPKRYFGQNSKLRVLLDGQKKEIEVNKLIQAAWDHLIKLTKKFRDNYSNRFAEGRFTTAVITYPTIAPPGVRRDIRKLIEEVGIPDVQIAYDEAVSVAIFFLWREFGGDLNLGIESFKTRCRYVDNQWSQNVLVLDIGGGTTDIALMRLTLSEIDPFKSGEDRGAGGRYYKLTPQLLGSSGHLQLGGELITLWLFKLLKVAIADCLLSAVVDGSLESEHLENLIRSLNPRFLESGSFKKGTLVACIDKDDPEAESAAYEEALKDAERVIPTQWKSTESTNTASKLQNFYTLWEYAEKAKLKFGEKNSQENKSQTFVLSEPDISQLLRISGTEFAVKNPQNLQVTINKQQFERAANRVIEEAVNIAQELVKSRLASENSSIANTTHQKVDWLILSGKTCNFYLVGDEIRHKFSKEDYFTWNPERVTFTPQFTKLATSAGACYAEKLRRLIFNPRDSVDILRKGANQLYIDVKNLFYFLPCSFVLREQSGREILLFKAGEKLHQIDSQDSEDKKARTKWTGLQLNSLVYRKDFEKSQLQFWGSFVKQDFCRENGLDITDQDFQQKIKVQFEVNYKLDFKLLLCWGEPHYWIAAKLQKLDVTREWGKSDIIVDGKVLFDIAVNVLEAQAVHKPDAYHLVFDSSQNYQQSERYFYYEDAPTAEAIKGIVSQPLPPFPRSGKHTFYYRLSNTDQWTLIGELGNFAHSTESDSKYYVSLDEKGSLRLHIGELPYCNSGDPKILTQKQGWVYQAELQLEEKSMNEKRDPFSGTH